jgi:hypothetical protein
MKRKTLALTLVLALLFSAVAGAQLNLLAKANFIFPPGNPIITILSPTNNTSYNVSTLSLKATFETYHTAFEAPIVSNKTRVFSYALDGKTPEPLTIITARDEGYPGGDVFIESSDILPELTEGLHNLTVRIVSDYFQQPNDRFHTESESTVYFRIDRVPPEVVFLSLENKTYYTTDVPLNFTVNESDTQIVYSLDGGENVTTVGNTTLTNLPSGEHNITVYAIDSAGNTGTPETIHFKIEPFPTTLIVAIVVIVAIAGVGVLFYFKKRKY